MTTLDAGAPRRLSSSAARRLLFAAMGAMTLWALYVYDWPLLQPHSPDMARLQSYGWWLPAHAAFGVAALLIGPFQFSARLRARDLRLHRRLGQTYVGCVTAAALMAIVIGLWFEAFGITQVLAQAMAWLVCTHAAWFAARGRNIAQHKLWIARSYGLTFIFVTNRAVLGTFFVGASNWAINDANWAVMTVALVVPDLIMAGSALNPFKRA